MEGVSTYYWSPLYPCPGSSWFAMSCSMGVFAYFLAGTLTEIEAVAFRQSESLYGLFCHSLASIIARASCFCLILILHFSFPPLFFTQIGVGFTLIMLWRVLLHWPPLFEGRNRILGKEMSLEEEMGGKISTVKEKIS